MDKNWRNNQRKQFRLVDKIWKQFRLVEKIVGGKGLDNQLVSSLGWWIRFGSSLGWWIRSTEVSKACLEPSRSWKKIQISTSGD